MQIFHYLYLESGGGIFFFQSQPVVVLCPHSGLHVLPAVFLVLEENVLISQSGCTGITLGWTELLSVGSPESRGGRLK
jgi:hypothetical protein